VFNEHYIACLMNITNKLRPYRFTLWFQSIYYL